MHLSSKALTGPSLLFARFPCVSLSHILSPGVDPKSIVCEYYRRGQCVKGFKCKFSHDLSVERKSQKIDLYSDRRDESEEGECHADEVAGALNTRTFYAVLMPASITSYCSLLSARYAFADTTEDWY